MSKTLLLFALVLGIFLTACMPPNQSEAAKAAAALVGGTTYTLGTGASVNISKGAHKSVTLEILGMKTVSPMLATAAAYSFYKRAKPWPADRDILAVTLSGDNSKYEQQYDVDTLALVEDYMHSTVNTFFNSYLDDNLHSPYDSIRYVIDTSTSDTDIHAFVGLLHRIDSVYGKLAEINLINFSFRSMPATGEPILAIWMNAANAKQGARFRFLISLKKRKLLGVHINPKDE